MKINWKVRFKNPHWWVSVALAVATPIGAYYGLTGSDATIRISVAEWETPLTQTVSLGA